MLASDQIQFSLLYRKHEKDGLLAKAKELGVSVIAYSPLCQGMLTGRLVFVFGPAWFEIDFETQILIMLNAKLF